MVAPFCGCFFGGFIYDVMIYTGPSPVNTPWFGLKRYLRPDVAWKARKEHEQRNKAEGVV
jgi:aquaglyceroporin related protein